MRKKEYALYWVLTIAVLLVYSYYSEAIGEVIGQLLPSGAGGD